MVLPSQTTQDDQVVNVLTASVHDVRYLVALLRGVNFNNRANVTITSQGLTIAVEEARTLLGTAFVFAHVFDEYNYRPDPQAGPQTRRKRRTQGNGSDSETEPETDDVAPEDGETMTTAVEIPLGTVIECLNIFGTAGSTLTEGGKSKAKSRRRRDGEGDEGDEGEDRSALDALLGVSGSEKQTGMRLTYSGSGYPLRLVIAEDAYGPTTTCEIATYDPEPQLELDFDSGSVVLKIILKSSWLKDALSEIDSSCDKITFIGNPPDSNTQSNQREDSNRQKPGRRKSAVTPKPMLRIRAAGTFGITEMDYPNDREVLETFECTTNVKFSYRVSHMTRTLRALQNSTKTSLRIDEEGLLSLQFLMPSSKGKQGKSTDAFIEFRCLPLDEGH